jgi:hypothetical protein
MNITNTQNSNYKKPDFNSYSGEDLFRVLPLFLEADLESPQIEAMAKDFLAALRKQGCEIQEADLDCEGCAACLHLSLMSALSYLPE